MKPRSNSKPLATPQRRQPAHELFPQPGVYRPQRFPGPRRQKEPWNLLWGVIFLCLLVIGCGIFGWLRKPHIQAPYMLVEVRALEEHGHPVAAAKVSINNKSMGVTDSFGEWRRYMRLKSGEQLSIELNKAGEGGGRGKKVLRVPSLRRDDGAPELRATIELRARPTSKLARRGESQSRSYPEESERLGRDSREQRDERDDGMVSMPEPENEVPLLEPEPREESGELGDSNDASLGIYFEDGLSAISVRALSLKGAPSNILEKHQDEILQEKIVPMLATDLQKLGLKIDGKAPWKLSLQYVPKEDQVGYIRAQVAWQNPFGQDERTSFIAGFAKTFDETARALSSLLRVHMRKSYWAAKEGSRWYIDEPADTKTFWRLKPNTQLIDTNGQPFPIKLVDQHQGSKRWQLQMGQIQPCQNVRQRMRCLVSTQSLKDSAPLVGWQKKRMNIQGAVPKNADVYVAGFLARPLTGNQWEYWGHPGSNHKALIVAQGRIVHSEIFVDQPSVQTVLRVIPNSGLRQARR